MMKYLIPASALRASPIAPRDADIAAAASAPAVRVRTAMFSKQPAILRVDDVNTEDIPVMATIADMKAARETRAENERAANKRAANKRAANKRAAAGADGGHVKKTRTVPPGNTVDTAADGGEEAAALPHIEQLKALEELQGIDTKSQRFLLFGCTDERPQLCKKRPSSPKETQAVFPNKTQKIAARKKTFTPLGVLVTAPKQDCLKKLLNEVEFGTLHQRDPTFPVEPEPLPDFSNYFENGRWRSQHVVLHVIDKILCSMKSHSGQRDGHDFVLIDVMRKFLQAFHATNCSCGCGRHYCRSVLYLNGPSRISPDRKFDGCDYGHVLQVITLVDKRHNTPIKDDTVPTVRSHPASWLTVTTSDTLKNYRTRSEVLINKRTKNEVELAELQRYVYEKAMEEVRKLLKALKKAGKSLPEDVAAQIKAFDLDDRYHSSASIRRMLVTLRKITKVCANLDCGNKLCYGDDGHHDKMTLAHVPTRASPDRLLNALGYIGNTRLVCSSCNFSENEYSRVDDERTKSTKTPLYKLADYKGRCIAYLEGLIAMEAHEPTAEEKAELDKADLDKLVKEKAKLKKALRKRIIAMTE
ncbi:hypothetical protein JKP88DRAFT_255454 [Tribonema minus]|uniref:Uncharacterized protein n=1 Tax=Tribonema minus TaxID=303371 RepID=A0A836CFE0_9STRA|nr:hypothetical protein JKP88DRAFT_255454 [Tribonema minus]